MKDLLIVCGMHRSGTSLVSRSLSKTGLSFGSAYIKDQPSVNRDGFYEDERVVAINESILAKNDRQWWSIERFEDKSPDTSIIQIRQLLKSIDQPCYAIKDPRLSLTLDLWLQAASLESISVKVVWVERSPVSIALSLYRRDLLPTEIAYELISVYRDSFFSVAESYDGYLGVIHYPPIQQDLDDFQILDQWLDSLGMTSFNQAYLKEYDDTENRNHVSTSSLGLREKHQILERWKETHDLIGELEFDLNKSREEWINKRIRHEIDRDEHWHKQLEKRIVELEEENQIYRDRNFKHLRALFLLVKRKVRRFFIKDEL